ncbi:DUF1090 domain-containing protein [Helicobacter cappadocius]|uniref:DUF1090 domain-containing protein n=1 Tax=Helicobacter cappadocius TaxID=3063998 RepID=A0AA90PLF9_9HELI|nr:MULTISPECIES: DUF1090 domain-containing protein [unclassified Helicobacter]MDO7253417.1 DUF1090 domain-containing protein [Helicobacter sp. faydin-H75]MDP2539319.1 DUF1090 domain-containing protein [Helicobacter sp. faydin-H76]
MKKIIVLSFVACGILLAGPVCDFKEKDVQNQIDYANKHGHKDKISGLKKALKELQKHCKDDVVIAEIKTDITKLEQKITEVKQKLSEVQAKGKSDRIKKTEMKLKMVQTELDSKKQELKKMEDLLTPPASKSSK